MGAGNARAAQRAIGRSVTNITGMALAVAVSESGVSAAMLSRPDWVEAPRAYARHASPEGTASYAASEKRGLLSEAEQCKARGEFGALMRRNRLHSSIPSSWRQHFSGADRAAHALPGFFRMVRHRISSRTSHSASTRCMPRSSFTRLASRASPRLRPACPPPSGSTRPRTTPYHPTSHPLTH
jgi:hypothetical protein